jgi:hypothetical protein
MHERIDNDRKPYLREAPPPTQKLFDMQAQGLPGWASGNSAGTTERKGRSRGPRNVFAGTGSVGFRHGVLRYQIRARAVCDRTSSSRNMPTGAYLRQISLDRQQGMGETEQKCARATTADRCYLRLIFQPPYIGDATLRKTPRLRRHWSRACA